MSLAELAATHPHLQLELPCQGFARGGMFTTESFQRMDKIWIKSFSSVDEDVKNKMTRNLCGSSTPICLLHGSQLLCSVMPTLSRILQWKHQQRNWRWGKSAKGAKQTGHEYSWIRSLLQHSWWYQEIMILKGNIRLALHRTPVQFYSTKHEIYLSPGSWTCHLKLFIEL